MTRAATQRPKQRLEPGALPFDTIALLLQGGGALGAYEGGVYQALAERTFFPIGSPGFRSAPSTRLLSWATHPRGALRACANSGRR